MTDYRVNLCVIPECQVFTQWSRSNLDENKFAALVNFNMAVITHVLIQGVWNLQFCYWLSVLCIWGNR